MTGSGLTLVAGLLAVALAVAHGVGGELTSLRALARDRADEAAKLEIRAGWHLYTWHLALSGAALVALWSDVADGRSVLGWFVVASFAGSALLIVGLAASSGIRVVLRYPQSLLLAIVAAFAYWGLRP